MKPCTHVSILDNGLRSKFEHNYALDAALSARLSYLNVSHDIFCSARVEPDIFNELRGRPYFSVSMYDNIPASEAELEKRRFWAKLTRSEMDMSPSELQTNRVLNDIFKSDLESIPKSIWEEGKIVLFPGLMQHQILGLARFLRSHKNDIAATIVCQLMFDAKWLPWGRISKLGHKTYRKALQMIPRQGLNIHFTTENEHVAHFYKKSFGLKTTILPVPLAGSRPVVTPTSRIRVGYFGYSKTEKGFHLLPEALELCNEARQDLYFTVQINHHHFQDEIIKADKAIREFDNVHILNGALSREQYDHELSQNDIILLPYDPKYFGLRGSGVFVEAVSGGHLIVASKGIWAGRSIAEGEAIGEIFNPYTSRALAGAILRLCHELPTRRQQALEKRASFVEKNSIGTYVRTLLAFRQSDSNLA